MSRMKRVLIAGIMTPFIASIVTPASAQTAQRVPYEARVLAARPHIVITPRPFLYYRRCVERLQLQYRPSGPVLYPLTYCWWARR
jgi:hypothetical protein